jgi:hypothetical protein
MDVTSLSLFCSMLCSNSGQRQLFDNVFQQYIAGDQDGPFSHLHNFCIDNRDEKCAVTLTHDLQTFALNYGSSPTSSISFWTIFQNLIYLLP